jgi:hypothetical protein
MADKTTFVQLAEQIQHIDFLKTTPEIEEEDFERLEQHLQDLVSRKENKFDNIIAMIKKCDAYIAALETELKEIDQNLKSWKSNRQSIIGILKFAYQNNLISNKPTGLKYQGVFRRLQPKVVDNFSDWTEKECKEFGLLKTTTITRLFDNKTIEVKEEQIPDKDKLRLILAQNELTAPVAAELVQSYSFTYERRKRLSV